MAAERRPVQTSAVYLLNSAQFPAVPPPSPPSPVTPEPSELCTPIDELSLDLGAGPPPIAAAVAAGAIPIPKPAPESPFFVSGAPSPVSRPRSPSPSPSPSSSKEDAAAPSPRAKCEAESEPQIAAAAATSSPTNPSPLYGERLAGAVHVLGTAAAALQAVAQLYATSPAARDGFSAAVAAVVAAQRAGGKLVVVGVGKSGHVGRKLAATFNSLAVPASFLHPTEALHGDLGHVRPGADALLFVTYSGRTPELLGLLPHLRADMPLVVLTAATGADADADACEVARLRRRCHPSSPPASTIILPAPVHEDEKASFGVAAPTTSTTAALAVGDALAMVVSRELHAHRLPAVFGRNHPGGAIGADLRHGGSGRRAEVAEPEVVRHLVASPPRRWEDIPLLLPPPNPPNPPSSPTSSPAVPVPFPTAADVLHAGYASPSGWVRLRLPLPNSNNSNNKTYDAVAPPARIRALRPSDLSRPARDVPGLVVPRAEFVPLAGDAAVRSAVAWLREEGEERRRRGEEEEEEGGGREPVVAVLEQGEIIGVLEMRELLEHGGV